MGFLVPFFACFMLFSAAFAAQPPEGMGFYPANSPLVPREVQKAAESTFRLVTPDGDRVKLSEMTQSKSIEETLERLEVADIPDLEKAVLKIQILECRGKAVADCDLLDGFNQGTGFVTDDGLTMRTAHHVIRNQMNEGRGSAERPLQLLVFGPDNKILFTPETLQVTVESIGSNKKTDDMDTNYKLQDVAKLRLSRKIADPLVFSKTPAKGGDKVFMTGFVKALPDRQDFGAVASDGIARSVSMGHVMTKTEAHARAFEKFVIYPKDMMDLFLNSLIVNTSDGGPGFSGAPTLNAAGEVVGLYNAGAPVDGKAEPLRFSYSVPAQVLK